VQRDIDAVATARETANRISSDLAAKARSLEEKVRGYDKNSPAVPTAVVLSMIVISNGCARSLPELQAVNLPSPAEARRPDARSSYASPAQGNGCESAGSRDPQSAGRAEREDSRRVRMVRRDPATLRPGYGCASMREATSAEQMSPWKIAAWGMAAAALVLLAAFLA